MPCYCYTCEETNETIEEIFSMKQDKPEEITKDGKVFKRDWGAEHKCALVDGKLSSLDPFAIKKAVEATGKRKGTVGDIEKLAAELSEKREKIAGKDVIKEKVFSEYTRTHGGGKLKHPQLYREANKKEITVGDNGIEIN